MLKFKCPHCEKALSAKEHAADRVIRCTYCNGTLRVPPAPKPQTQPAPQPNPRPAAQTKPTPQPEPKPALPVAKIVAVEETAVPQAVPVAQPAPSNDVFGEADFAATNADPFAQSATPADVPKRPATPSRKKDPLLLVDDENTAWMIVIGGTVLITILGIGLGFMLRGMGFGPTF